MTTPFFLLSCLSTFDGFTAFDLLTQDQATLNLKDCKINLRNGSEQILYHDCKNVNFTSFKDLELPLGVKARFENIIAAKDKVFANPNESLLYTSAVVATIKTTNETPIYTKPYPYPMGVADFIAKAMEQLLKDGIIRKSRSL